jgi:NAD-dependent DNA ligase
MAKIEDVLEDVDGLRREAADQIQQRFASVGELASATTAQLTAIKGVGEVMADRIRSAAMQARDVPGTAKSAAARAANTADKGIDTSASTARRTIDDAEARARTNVHRLHATGDRTVDSISAAGRSATSTVLGFVGKGVSIASAPFRGIVRKLRGR